MSYFKKILVLALFLSVTGCAGIINGTTQDVTFKSEPEGATVSVDGLERGKTPLTVTLKKNEYKSVTFSKEGYKSESVPLQRKFDTVALLNVFWDLSTTDAITGALYEYEPNVYHVEMKKKGN